MFAEALSAHRVLLEVGNVVVLNISCAKNDDRIRITADKVQKFDDNYSNAYRYHLERSKNLWKNEDAEIQAHSAVSKQIVRIKISSREELTAVKSIIDNLGDNGKDEVELIIPDGRKMLLPKKYSIGSYDILDLRNAVGVANVEIGPQ
jgi:GTP-sensing pleiotropic transcriptional regulator CodY